MNVLHVRRRDLHVPLRLEDPSLHDDVVVFPVLDEAVGEALG